MASASWTRIREHLVLMGRGALAISGVGGVAGAYGGYQLVATDEASGWFWLFVGAVILFLAQVRAVQVALKQRDEARTQARTIVQKAVEVGDNASVDGLTMDRIRMSVGGEREPARTPRRRWWHRRLSEKERVDLADRCERCSTEMLAWLHRPKGVDPALAELPSDQQWEARRMRDDAHRDETEQRLHADFVARARDLLNECAEAGYALDSETEKLRVGGDIQWYNYDKLAAEVGVVGRRVRRGSKRVS